MKQAKQERGFIHTGTATLFVVFVVVVLVVLAITSLSAAHSDLEMAEQMAQQKTAYYQASSRAEEVLAQIDALLEQNWQDSTGWEAYLEEIRDLPEQVRAARADAPADLAWTESAVLAYTTALDDTRELHVQLAITNPEETGGFYRILAWETCDTSEWEETP